MDLDFTTAVLSDRIERTIDYQAVSQELLCFGNRGSWKLIERLASEIADMVVDKCKPVSVTVEVKKFVIPQARYVSVSHTRGLSERKRF